MSNATVETILIVLVIALLLALAVYSSWSRLRGLVSAKRTQEDIVDALEEAEDKAVQVATEVPVVEGEVVKDVEGVGQEGKSFERMV